MTSHNVGCMGHCLNAALKHLRHETCVDSIVDEMKVHTLYQELSKRTLKVEICVPLVSVSSVQFLGRASSRNSLLDSLRSLEGRGACFVIGSAYDLYRIDEAWTHAVVFLLDSSDDEGILYDPFETLVSSKGRDTLRCTPLEVLVQNAWISSLFAVR